MEKSHWGDHTDRVLEEVFNNPAFLTEVEDLRKLYKIPKLGFADIRRYRKLKEDVEFEKKIRVQASKMARARGLPKPYIQWIDAFIGVGFDCLEYVIPFNGEPIPGHAYSMAQKKDYIEFRFYNGGTLNGFIKFIRFGWGIAEYWLKDMDKDIKAPTVRKKSKERKTRNQKILNLHLEGKLRADGSWKDQNESEPIFSQNLSWDQKRKIINSEKRLMKISQKHKRQTK